MSEDTQAQLAEAAAENVRAFGRKTPEERFQWMVSRGLIDRAGRVTIRCGGDAQPEPDAIVPVGK